MKLRYLIPFLLAGVALAQTTKATLVSDPPGWLTVAAATDTFATTPSVIMPVGTQYRQWGTSNLGVTTYCDVQTATNQPVLVWVGPCKVGGQTVQDFAPFGNHSLMVQQIATAYTVSVVPPKGDPLPVTVPALGGTPPVIPPTTPTPTVFLCPGSPVVFTNPDGTKTQPVTLPIPTASLSGATAASNSNGPCTLITAVSQ